jgi:hypothetical protein
MRESPAVKRVEFVRDRMSDIIIPRGRWCDTALNVHTPSQIKVICKNGLYAELEWGLDHLSKYHMDISLGDFSTKVGKQVIFKTTKENGSLHEIIIFMGLEY